MCSSELLKADADSAEFAGAARDALADPRYDSVVCAAVKAFDKGTEDVILALENVAAEATKPLIGVFLDFHPPLSADGQPDSPGLLPRFDGSVDAIQALSALSRSEERRVGKECTEQCRSRWSPYH